MSSLFKPQLPSNQIVKMGIDERDIADIPMVVAKRQSSHGNGKCPASIQTSTGEAKGTKKEGQ